MIKDYDNLWFVKEKTDKYELIQKYLELTIDYIKGKNKLTILSIISPFLNTIIEKKIIYIYLIIDKCELSDMLILLFIGFILGDEQKFIKELYIESISTILLNFTKLEIKNKSKHLPFYDIKDKVFEIINLYIFLNQKKGKEKKTNNNLNIEESIDIEEEDIILLYNSLLDNNSFDELQLDYFYKKMLNIKEFDNIFSYDDDECELNVNIAFKMIINIIKNEIKNKINENKNMTAHILKTNNINRIMEIYELNKDSINNDIINKTDSKGKNEIINNKNVIINEKEYINKLEEEILYNETPNKGNNNYHQNEINNIQINNKNILYDNNNINKKTRIIKKEKKYEIFDSESDNNSNESTSINSNSSKSLYNKLYKINNYINFPEIEYLKSEKYDSKTKDSELLIFQIFELNECVILLREKIEKIKSYLDNSIFNIKIYKEKINLECDLKNMEIINKRLEIIIQLIQNPNILKRKIIEVLLFELLKAKKEEFLLPKDYKPNIHNLEELEKLIKKKIKNL